MSRPMLTPLMFMLILTSCLTVSFPLVIYLMYTYTTIIIEWTLMNLTSAPMTFTILLDPPALIFSFSVNLISFAVMLFSLDYMHQEKHLTRFTSLVALFVLSMNLLIFMPNMITLMIGWDGLGLVSFLLVIYYQNPRSLAAGMLTALTNRVGDALIIISIMMMFKNGTWTLMQPWLTPPILLSFLLTTAAMTKSAQIPFTSWLPAAMAAPTPVSALVHSSTLVTAGIYLLYRLYPLLITNPYTLPFLLIMATLTTTMAGLAALVENDMKKIIALSTLSQLGLMMMSLGLAAPLFTFFHLITHAMFKALLFICAGTIIHAHTSNQDLRFFSNLSEKLPFTSLALTTANLTLMGTPFLAAFYSKDLIIELTTTSPTNLTIAALMLFSTLLTAMYSIRFTNFTLFNHQMFRPTPQMSDSDSYYSTAGMTLLMLAAIITGTVMNWLMVFPTHSLPLLLPIKLIPLLLIIIAATLLLPTGLLILMHCYSNSNHISNFLTTMWFITPSITHWPSYYTPYYSTNTTFYWDQGWNELLSAQGASMLATFLYKPIKSLQNLMVPQATLFALVLISLTTISLL